MEGKATVNGAELWYRVSGQGEPVIQIHGSGFGHYNFDPVTPELSKEFTVIDFDMRGYGLSDRPEQAYDMEVWADDVVGLMDRMAVERAHIHGSSMGGMIAIVVAGKFPDRTQSVVVNCAAAKFGRSGRLMIDNWSEIVRLDPAGVGSRLLAETVAWQALSRRFIASEQGAAAIDRINEILAASNSVDVFTKACRAMMEMDLRPWLKKIGCSALVIGGSEDIMTPWDQGPDGAGQEAIFEGIEGARKEVIAGSAHSSIFDATAEYVAAVRRFLVSASHGGTQSRQAEGASEVGKKQGLDGSVRS